MPLSREMMNLPIHCPEWRANTESDEGHRHQWRQDNRKQDGLGLTPCPSAVASSSSRERYFESPRLLGGGKEKHERVVFVYPRGHQS